MTQSKPLDDEIDLFDLMQSIWEGKWTVLLIALVFGVCGVGYALYAPAKYSVETEIRPISSSDAQLYRDFNSLGFNTIERGQLLSLFVEYLDDKELMADAFKNSGLVAQSPDESNEAYQIRLIDRASDIEILAPVNADGAEKGDMRKHWSFSFATKDEQRARAFLDYLYTHVTADVEALLNERFQTSVAIAQKQKAFKLEDIERSIANKLADYDQKVANRLAYLKEQAAIARTLGVARNTIEAQTFASQSGVVASFQSDSPFYLRGYEAIEKEMDLLQSRTNKEAFVDGLLEQRQALRSLKQDPLIERATSLLQLTPLRSEAPFKAVVPLRVTSDFSSDSKKPIIVIAAVLFGGMLGVLYVLVRAGFRKRSRHV